MCLPNDMDACVQKENGLFKCLLELVFLFSSDEYPEVELMDHMIVVF